MKDSKHEPQIREEDEDEDDNQSAAATPLVNNTASNEEEKKDEEDAGDSGAGSSAADVDGLTQAMKAVNLNPDGFTYSDLINGIKAGTYKKILVMTGAGVSVSAGIPDFRTPGTGLYSQLEEYNLPRPEAIFTLDYFINKPEPFYKFA